MDDLCHSWWTTVASFLSRADRFSLLALNRSVMYSQIRKDFFSESQWRVPPVEWLAKKVLKQLTMKQFIFAAAIDDPWQQSYLTEFPDLERIHYVHSDNGNLVFSSWLFPHIMNIDIMCDDIAMDAFNSLTQLKQLQLTGNLQNHDKLDALPNLVELSVVDAMEETLEWTSKVPNVQTLQASCTAISLECLRTLQHLQVLSVCGCDIPDISPLAAVGPQLRKLNVASGYVDAAVSRDDMDAFIASLTKLESLSLRDTGLLSSDLAPLAGLSNLSALLLDVELHPRDLTPLGGLTNLEKLSLNVDSTIDWSPIGNLKRLKKLKPNQEYDYRSKSLLRALTELPSLRSLKRPTRLSNSNPLPQLTKLKVVSENPNKLRFDVGSCPNLESLSVAGCFNLKTLAQSFSKLKTLDLDELRECDDFRALADLVFLEILRFPHEGECEYSHGFSFLSGMTRMEDLQMWDVPISDLSVIRNMKRLRRLTLSGTPVEDISIAATLLQLNELNISGTNVQDVTCLEGHPSLQYLVLPDGVSCSALVKNYGVSLPNIRSIRDASDSDCLWRQHSTPGDANSTD